VNPGWKFYTRSIRRESRGARSRLVFFVACLAVGVAAVVAVAGLSASLDRTIRGEARQLLAADIAVESRRPLPAALADALRKIAGVERADLTEMVTVAAAPPSASGPGRSQLVELKVVEGGYPFYGKLRVEPDRPLVSLLAADTAVVGPDLLARLALRVGDSLRLGGADFRIAGTVLAEPDRMGGTFSVGPRVFLAHDGLKRTVLEGAGSRVLYRALLKLPTETPAARTKAIAAGLDTALAKAGRIRVENYTEAQPSLRRGLRRAERFLGLVALLSLLLGGVGVAQTVRAWVAGRLDAIAVLRCLGLRPREVLRLYLVQTAVLGLVGSAAGCVAGVAVQWIVPGVLGDLVPAGAGRTLEWSAIARGLLLGVGVALLFSLPPLLATRRVPPMRVLRHDAEPLPTPRWAAAALAAVLLGGIWLFATLQAGSALLGAEFAGGAVAATLALAGAGVALARLVGRAPRRFARVWVRHGLAALARPGASTVGAIVGLGLGVLVVLGMSQVERQLAAQIDRELPHDAPTAFLIDIQPDQWAGVRDLLTGAGATGVDSVPVVMARLQAVDGKSVEDLAGRSPGERDRRWALTREQRLTYLEKLPADNQVVEGRLWGDPSRPEVSLEADFAKEIGAKLGSRLGFDIQGVPIELWVTSLRTVKWETFGINFFLVVEPGVLEDAPQFRLAAARLPAGGEQQVQDRLAAAYPNVTMLQTRAILERIAGILRRIGLGVRFLGGFTVLAGIAILAGAVSAGSARRGREVALLKTLGMTRRGVGAVFATEYALIGAVAGVIGAAGGGVLSWFVLTRGMEAHWRLEPAAYGVAVAGAIGLAVAAGLAASLTALRRRPIEALRAE
jgi:putative ABC transport system permease protein